MAISRNAMLAGPSTDRTTMVRGRVFRFPSAFTVIFCVTIVDNTSAGMRGALMLVVNIPRGFLVPSTSGHATLALPILAPLADFAGVDRAIVVTAFQSASGLVNLVGILGVLSIGIVAVGATS